MTSLSHELETYVLDKNKSENESKWKDIGDSIHNIKEEWKEINSLYRSLLPSKPEEGDGEKGGGEGGDDEKGDDEESRDDSQEFLDGIENKI